jgi:hypothetical protein
MQGGDLSNSVVPRLVIVWDNLLGVLPSKPAEAKFSTYIRFKRWKKAVSLFEINEGMARQIWDLTWRKNFAVDLVTFTAGDDFAEALRERIEDREQLPIGHVWFEEPNNLSRSLAYRPDIACVIHANPHHQLTFGSKGRFISATTPSLLGVI